MAFNFISLSQQMVIWVLLFVGLVLVPSYSFTVYNKTLPSPLSHSPSSYHPNLNYPILKKRKKPPPTLPPPPPSPVVTQFDYWKLAETWPASFYKVNQIPKTSTFSGFTIHGLWPANKVGPQPRECGGMSIDFGKLALMKSKLDTYWPNLKGMGPNDGYFLWSDQWKNHGSCSSMLQSNFFNLGLQIYNKNELKTILDVNGIKPGGTKKEKINDIFKAIEKGIGKKPQIQCEMSYLLEIRVCLSKGSAPAYIDCTGQLTINCPPEVYFP